MRECVAFIVFVFLAVSPPAQVSAAEPFERFYGHFTGTSLTAGEGEIAARDLAVEIGPHERGFTVAWTTVIHKAGGRDKKAEVSINFHPTSRKNVYGSAMRNDFFGHAVPLDPLKGDPFVWAQISGDVLTVNSLIIFDDGGWEMQTYERELTANGMDLTFKRVRNGEQLKTVRAELVRHDG